MQEVKRFLKNGTILKTRSHTDHKAGEKLLRNFFTRDVLMVAPDLIGKILVIINSKNFPERFMITETEAYRGEEDEACHACRGRTGRTDVMYHEGGKIYVYFVYGMYWMLNFVTCEKNNPQAVLIRGLEGISGPGRVTRALKIDKSYYGEDLIFSKRIWIEDKGTKPKVKTGPRIGINYAGAKWKNKSWRYMIDPKIP